MIIILTILMLVCLLATSVCFLAMMGVSTAVQKMAAQIGVLEERISLIEIDRELHGETEDTFQMLQPMPPFSVKVRES